MTLVELLELNNNYHSQSGNGIGTDKEFRHKYCSDYYDRIIPCYKDKEITLLEVGTGHGGSLILWNDYFPKATIYGVDVGDMTNSAIKQYTRINTLIGDAYNITKIGDLKYEAIDTREQTGLHDNISFIVYK